MSQRPTPREIPMCVNLTDGPDGFTFRDDLFDCGEKGSAQGAWEPPSRRNRGMLRTRLQPVLGSASGPTSGGWTLRISLADPALLRIETRYAARTGGGFAPGQFADVLLTVDGRPVGRNPHGSLVRIRPSEIGGDAPLDTGWQEAALDVHLPAGPHTVRLGLCAAAGLAAGAWSEMLVDRVDIRPVGTVSFTGDGGFVINAGGRSFAGVSSFSRPGGGWYRIGAATPAPGEVAEWQVRTERHTGTAWEGTAETPQFRLHRAIRVDGHRVRVEDTLTNLSDVDMGWMIRNELAVPVDEASTPVVHLGGDSRTDPSTVYARVIKDGTRVSGIDCWRPSNPTVFVPFREGGVGLAAEDDVTRVHSLTYWRRTAPTSMAVGLRDENFALPPGGRYTIRWSAYIIPGTGMTYYDFINQVRADWKLNDIRVPGPTVWSTFMDAMGSMTDEDIKSRLDRTGAWAIATSLNGWIDPESIRSRAYPGQPVPAGFGPGVLDPSFAALRAKWARDCERIHRLAPGVGLIHYFHTFLYGPQRNPNRLMDSWVTRRDGTLAVIDWTPLGLMPSALVYPTRTNAVGRGMGKVLKEMAGPMKGDGIYFDEVNYPSGIGWLGSPPLTYNLWDGHSAELDPGTFAVVRKCGYLQLLSGDFKKALFRRLTRDGRIVLGNGEPDTWWEDGLKFPRHTECRTDPYPRAYESHLYSPIALVEDRSFKHTLEMLKYGVIDCFVRLEDPDLGSQEHIVRSFPLTVQSIHSGWLQGKERIITMVSGTYSWHESARVKILEFGADGRLSSTREAASASGAFDITVPKDGLVIAVRTADR